MIGERLGELRKDAKMKQEDLANKLSLTRHTISSYETENSTPSDEIKVEIAKIFNVSLDYLLGLIRSPLSYKRDENCLYLPKDIPEEAIAEINEYIKYIKSKYKLNN